MSAFSLFVILLVIVAAAWGWQRGIISQAGQLAASILAIVACRLLVSPVTHILVGDDTSASDTVLYSVLAYVIVYAGIYVGVSMAGKVLRTMLSVVRLGVIDHIAGAVFKVVVWLIALSLALNLWTAIFPDTTLADSPLYGRVLQFAPTLLGSETARQLYDTVTETVSSLVG